MSIAIIGVDGQLGADLRDAAVRRGMNVKGYTHQYLEVADRQSVANALVDDESGVIINTAAFHDLLGCEEDSERAFETNVLGAENIAAHCLHSGKRLVHISTDYVDVCSTGGTKSIYGISKRMGENAISMLLPSQQFLIVRIGTLFGRYGCRAKNGGNLVDTIVKKLKDGLDIELPCDTMMRATYARECAEAILNAIERGLNGVVYGTNYPVMSHFQFGRDIALFLDVHLDRVKGRMTDLGVEPWRPVTMRYHYPELPRHRAGDTLYHYMLEKGYIDADNGWGHTTTG